MRGKIVIDKELCKGCRYCVTACPNGVIEIKNEFNKSGYFFAFPHNIDKCTGCAFCAQACPEIAIEVWRENNTK